MNINQYRRHKSFKKINELINTQIKIQEQIKNNNNNNYNIILKETKDIKNYLVTLTILFTTLLIIFNIILYTKNCVTI